MGDVKVYKVSHTVFGYQRIIGYTGSVGVTDYGVSVPPEVAESMAVGGIFVLEDYTIERIQ